MQSLRRRGVLLPIAVSAGALVAFLASSSSLSRQPVAVAPAAVSSVRDGAQAVAFGAGTSSDDARRLASGIAVTLDHGDNGFILVDKRTAQLHVFDADARWVASAPVLIGAAPGDDSVPGIGSRPMASIRVHERTTPAGRFVGERGRNAAGENVIWVDYDAAVSMHRVRLSDPRERRAERLASATAADNRISYGCINVSPAFYERHVQPLFSRHRAVIYVLPDTRSVQEVFGPLAAATEPVAARGVALRVDQRSAPASRASHDLPR